ncbi:hypothetical protein D9615_008754 [Tricholomella constricta]|uniref:Restriction of telomere capping protein 4 n=1 Tax=Tricholomella constricta TaxID=117010 RepID=A0A8H5H8H0_9AGAR|nr:hypothetical protein D9615_008754 [Tricholomella constricta]
MKVPHQEGNISGEGWSERAFKHTDAEKLVQRVLARETRAPLPDDITNAPLRPAAPTLITEGAVFCINACKTKGGNRTRGSQACIELKCKTCRRDAAEDAKANNCPRDPCKAHKVLAVADIQPLTSRQTASQALAPRAGSQSSESSGFSTPEPFSPTPTSSSRSAPSQPHPQPSQLQSQPHSQIPTATNRRRALAQPIGPNWLKRKTAADQEKASMESLKVCRQQMDEIVKKTCTFVIYRKSGAPPIELRREVKTYPQLELYATLADLMAEFKLTRKSLFDFWDAGHWAVITAETPIIVEKGRRILLRFRPSFEEQLSLTDCLGITDELTRQPRITGTKRGGEIELVSPLKKAVKSSIASFSGPSLPASSPPPRISTTPLLKLELDTAHVARDFLEIDGIARVKTLQELPIASWDAGWKQIAQLIDKDPRNVMESESFPKVFGITYSKSSVCKYKSDFKKAPKELRDEFIMMGNVKAATWREFSRAVRTWRPTDAHHFPIASAIDLTIDDSDHEDQIPVVPTLTPPACSARPSSSTTSASTITTAASAPILDYVLTAGPPSPVPAAVPRDFPVLSPLPRTPHTPLPLAPANTIRICSALANIICNYGSDNDDDDNNIDHTLLCPFCDRQLPDNPTPGLLRQRASLEKQSRLDPMPNNRFHRSTESFTIFVDFCQRHTFEHKQLPRAQQAGWPVSPIFATLFDHVVAHYPALTKVLTDTKNTFFSDAKQFYRKTAARMQGASSQYSSARFTQFGAGYYGERGYQIIFTALQHRFSFSIDKAHIHPLSQDTFLREILVPEAAVLIIQEDLHLSHFQAIETLRASHTFGNTMHPIDDTCSIGHEATRRGMYIFQCLQPLFRFWQASKTMLDFETWAKEQNDKEEEHRVKQEEMDLNIIRDKSEDSGMGIEGDPIDLTSD